MRNSKSIDNFETFLVAFDSASLQIVTSVTLNGLEALTPYSGYDGCYGSILPRCPVVKEKPYLFSRIFRVQSEFPVVRKSRLFLLYPLSGNNGFRNLESEINVTIKKKSIGMTKWFIFLC